jgi:AcrR family transcriptional regulator
MTPTHASEDEQPPPLARSRRSRSHATIIDATLRLLERTRYRDLTMEAIAAEARVGKATVYRWWPSKAALVAEALASTLVVENPPTTGNLRNDLIAAVQVSMTNYMRPPSGHLVLALASDIADDSTLLESFRTYFILPRRHVVGDLIKYGIATGQLPADTDIDLIMDMWAGAILYRSLFRHAPTGDHLANVLVSTIFADLV